MFLLNSRLGHFSATSQSLEEATLFPKLQVYFAEFLGRDSLEHLRILSLTTCVGLRYGLLYNKRLEDFLGSLFRNTIHSSEDLRYYHLRHFVRICLHENALHSELKSLMSSIYHAPSLH